MLPAHQGLGSGQGTGFKINLRLVKEYQLIALYSLSQLALHLQPAGYLCLHAGLMSGHYCTRTAPALAASQGIVERLYSATRDPKYILNA